MYSWSGRERFEKVTSVMIETGTENYQDWSVTFLCLLYAYEIWKDGSEWRYVRDLLYKVESKEYYIEKLHNIFNYPIQDN